ncbi:MAG: DUF4412 domain-containing protein [Pseudomonadota bacterium]
MKAFLFASILFPTLALAASEGLRVVYDIDFPGETANSARTKIKARYFIQEGAVRFETEAAAPAQSTVLIGKAQPRKAFLIFPSRKAYMEIPETKATSADRKAQTEVPFKATGQKKEIAGYSCQVVARELTDQKEEACTSEKLVKDLKNLQSALPASKGSKGSIPKGMDGFPLEYQVLNKKATDGKNESAMTMRVAEVKREKFNSSLFEVPSGYQKQEMPAMPTNAGKGMSPGGTKGQQKLPPGFEQKLQEMKKMMQEQQNQKLQQPQ